MIKTTEEIKLLLKSTSKEPIYWHYSLTEMVSPLIPFESCSKELEREFCGELKESQYFDGEYLCRGFFYRGRLFLIEDMHSDGEDEWNADTQIINFVTASQLIKTAMETLTQYLRNQLVETKQR